MGTQGTRTFSDIPSNELFALNAAAEEELCLLPLVGRVRQGEYKTRVLLAAAATIQQLIESTPRR